MNKNYANVVALEPLTWMLICFCGTALLTHIYRRVGK